MYIKIIPDALGFCGDICKTALSSLCQPFPWLSQDCFVCSLCTHLLFYPDLATTFHHPTDAVHHLLQFLYPPGCSNWLCSMVWLKWSLLSSGSFWVETSPFPLKSFFLVLSSFTTITSILNAALLSGFSALCVSKREVEIFPFPLPGAMTFGTELHPEWLCWSRNRVFLNWI